MDFITNRLAIGNSNDARNVEMLFSKGIGGLLNVAIDLDISHFQSSSGGCGLSTTSSHKFPLEYQKVGMIDGAGNDKTVLIAALYMLDNLLSRHDKVMVHCHAGVSRSSIVVASYLVHRRGIALDIDKAVEIVRRKRKGAGPNPALIKLAKSITNPFDAAMEDVGGSLLQHPHTSPPSEVTYASDC